LLKTLTIVLLFYTIDYCIFVNYNIIIKFSIWGVTMKNKFIIGILAILLCLSVALVACNNGSDFTNDDYEIEITMQSAEDILSQIELGDTVTAQIAAGYHSTRAYSKNGNEFVVYERYESTYGTTESYIGKEGSDYYSVFVNVSGATMHYKVNEWEAKKSLLDAENTLNNYYQNIIHQYMGEVERAKSYGGDFGKVSVYGNAYKAEPEDTMPDTASITYAAKIMIDAKVRTLTLNYQITNSKLSGIHIGYAIVEDYVSDNERQLRDANNLSIQMEFSYDDPVQMPTNKGDLTTPTTYASVYLSNTTTSPLYDQVRGEKIDLPTPVEEGEFLGWYYDSNFQLPIEGKYQVGYGENNSVYAKWDVPTAKLELNGGKLLPDAESTWKDCTIIKDIDRVTNVHKAGYVFYGWFTDADFANPVYNDNGLIKANTTLYAKWLPLVTITLNADVTYPLPKLMGVAGRDTNLDNVVVTKRGKIFEGWYTNSNFSTPAPDVFPTSNATYHAKFTPAICVEFNFDDADLTPNNLDFYLNIPLTESEEYTFADLYDELSNDYSGGTSANNTAFNGWFTDKALTKEFTSYPTGNITLYPKLSPFYYYNLRAGEGTLQPYYEDNNTSRINWLKAHSASPAEQLALMADATHGFGLLIPPEGKVFVGWYTDAALTNPYNPTKYPTSTMTIYAKFAPIED